MLRRPRTFRFAPYIGAVRSSLVLAWPALVGFVAIRTLSVLALGLVAAQRDVDLWHLLHSRFDSLWYTGIAQHGYDSAFPVSGDDGTRLSNLAFFPLYPLLIRLVACLPGISVKGAALLVSWTAGVIAAWGLFAIGNHLHGRRCGIFLACLWSALPHGIVLSMAYTEAPFTALAAWTLWALLEKRWIVAGVLCLFAGLVRPTSAALIASVGLTAATVIWRQEHGLRAGIMALMSPIGLLGYVAWVGIRTGALTGYFDVQKAWGSPFDGGRFTLEFLQNLVLSKERLALAIYVVATVLVWSVLLFAWSVLERQPVPLLAYSFTMLVLTIGTGGFFHSKARLLLPAFPLLLPIARGLTAVKPRAAGFLALGALIGFSTVFSLHLRLTWRWSP